MRAAYKILMAGVALMLLGWAAVCGRQHFTAQQVQSHATLDTLGRAVIQTDGVFVTDTLKFRRALAITDTVRRNLVLTDTVRVRRVLTHDSVTIRACTEVVSSCAATIKARDNEIAKLRQSILTPRLTYPAEVLYDPFARTALVRAGAELRLFSGFSLKAESEFDQTRGLAVRVGLRKVF